MGYIMNTLWPFGSIKVHFRKRRAVKARRAEQRDAALKTCIANHEDSLELCRQEMFKHPCPINDGGFCFEGCVHFNGGRVNGIFSSIVNKDEPIDIWIVYPSCKLWSRP